MSNPILVQPAHDSWVTEDLGTCCDLISRGSAPSYVDASSVLAIGQRCVSSAGFVAGNARPHDSRRLHGTLGPRPGDVLLNSTGTGTIGRSCVFDDPGSSFIVDGHVTVLRPGVSSDGRWINAALRHPDGQRTLECYCYSGSTNQVELSRSRLLRVRVAHPPLPEQQRIADVLDALDEAILKTEEVIAKLQQMKQGLLHDLLTRGIDDNGELRDPERHPEQFKDSELGRIPREWEVTTAGAACSLITKGTTPAARYMWRGASGVRFLRVDNLTFDGKLDLDASDFRISWRTHVNALARSRVLPGDVLTNIVGPPLGKLGIVTPKNGEMNINQAIAVFRPLDRLQSEFLLAWLAGDGSRRWFRQRAKQTSGQLNLTLAMCQSLPIPVLGAHEQEAVVSRLDAAATRQRGEAQLLLKLRQLKSALADDLLTGRVRVPTPAEATP